jgi:hypothetical protein
VLRGEHRVNIQSETNRRLTERERERERETSTAARCFRSKQVLGSS